MFYEKNYLKEELEFLYSQYLFIYDYLLEENKLFEEIEYILKFISLFKDFKDNKISLKELDYSIYELEDYFYCNVFESTDEYDDLIVEVVNILEGNYIR